MFEHCVVPDLRASAFQRNTHGLQEGVEAHQAEADRTLTLCRIDGTCHFVWSALDEVFQNVVEETENVFDELRIRLPFEEFLSVQRGQAANSCTLIAKMVCTGWQNDL